MSDVTIAQTEVNHNGKWFFVSTIERDSSAAVSPPPRYFETLVWEYDRATGKRGAIVGQYSGCRALDTHLAVVSGFYRNGRYEEGVEGGPSN